MFAMTGHQHKGTSFDILHSKFVISFHKKVENDGCDGWHMNILLSGLMTHGREMIPELPFQMDLILESQAERINRL